MMLAEVPREPPLPLCHDQLFSAQIAAAYFILIHKIPPWPPASQDQLWEQSQKFRRSPSVHRDLRTPSICYRYWKHRGHKRGHGGLNTSVIHLQLSGKDWNQ